MSAPWSLGDAISVDQVLARWRPHLIAGESPSRDDVERSLSRVGRCSGPELLAELLRLGALTPETAALTGTTWSMAECPDADLPRKTWRALFGLAGFCADGVPTERPTQPLVLYRGATAARRRCWSWTDDRSVAEAYASGQYRREPGSVWVARVAPRRLLARVTERDEAEWIVDTTRLQICAESSFGPPPGPTAAT